tara:strand:+ start:4369 stop:5118 length:750 start_codon:yes stop_codon:yes gene_type:complete
MFIRTLTTILTFICLLSVYYANDKYSSFKDLKKIPDGMNIIHVGNSKTAIVAVHGFYPFYWVEIHHEWVQPFNYLVKKNINTFFYKYDWNECPSTVSKHFSNKLQKLIQDNPEINNWQVVGHSMGGSVVMFTNQSFPPNENITFNTVATPVNYERDKTSFLIRLYESIFTKNCSENINSLDKEFENGFTNEHVQWRNLKEYDSQFKNYDFDPYDRIIKNSTVFQFPDSLNGERVGHTSSLYFSILEIIN